MGVPTAWFSASVETRGRFPRQSMAGGHLNKSDCVSQPPKVFLQHEARSHAERSSKEMSVHNDVRPRFLPGQNSLIITTRVGGVYCWPGSVLFMKL